MSTGILGMHKCSMPRRDLYATERPVYIVVLGRRRLLASAENALQMLQWRYQGLSATSQRASLGNPPLHARVTNWTGGGLAKYSHETGSHANS